MASTARRQLCHSEKPSRCQTDVTWMPCTSLGHVHALKDECRGAQRFASCQRSSLAETWPDKSAITDVQTAGRLPRRGLGTVHGSKTRACVWASTQ